MRYLLKEDEKKYNSIKTWVNENWSKRHPDKSKPTSNFWIKYCTRDLYAELLMYKLRGDDFTEYDSIYNKANSKANFVVPEIVLNDDEKDDYKTATGIVYSANKEFLDNYDIKLYYEKLINLSMSYLSSLGYKDSRNFYEENGAVMYGQRERNRYDAHLLGDIVSGTFVMSSKDYDAVLINFKNKTDL